MSLKKLCTGLALVAAAVMGSGCVSMPQHPVSLSPDAVGAQAGRMGVAMTPMPQLDTQIPGAGCLLCLMVASGANSTLTTHARTLPYEDLPKLKHQVAELLGKKGTAVTVIEEDLELNELPDFSAKEPNFARKDFSSLKQKYKVDRLLVIDINALGFIRTYSAYVPTSDPKALLRGTGYIVNLKNNTYEWYLPVEITRSADLNWDEPPKFPGLTNAYFQALEIGKDSFLQPLAIDPPAAAAEPKSGREASGPPISQTAVSSTSGQNIRQ